MIMTEDAPKIRDSQRSAVYAWERAFVAPHDRSNVPFEQIQGIVNYVWEREGLKYPPQVDKLPKNATKTGGDATRLKVRFHDSAPTWVILHELSHSMSSTFDGPSNHHGALFMGLYLQLLNRFLGLSIQDLMRTAEERGLRVKMDARPVFLD